MIGIASLFHYAKAQCKTLTLGRSQLGLKLMLLIYGLVIQKLPVISVTQLLMRRTMRKQEVLAVKYLIFQIRYLTKCLSRRRKVLALSRKHIHQIPQKMARMSKSRNCSETPRKMQWAIQGSNL
ncbi:MAG: hypothetical protein CBC98_07675 [Planctomycetaceae bacterium TMED138]|nr:MAG: hypothetical protein CBC98_07675 [Planctomycetaceae bacterium TMED138]